MSKKRKVLSLKKTLSLFLALCMVLTMMTAIPITAGAGGNASVTFSDGDADQVYFMGDTMSFSISSPELVALNGQTVRLGFGILTGSEASPTFNSSAVLSGVTDGNGVLNYLPATVSAGTTSVITGTVLSLPYTGIVAVKIYYFNGTSWAEAATIPLSNASGTRPAIFGLENIYPAEITANPDLGSGAQGTEDLYDMDISFLKQVVPGITGVISFTHLDLISDYEELSDLEAGITITKEADPGDGKTEQYTVGIDTGVVSFLANKGATIYVTSSSFSGKSASDFEAGALDVVGGTVSNLTFDDDTDTVSFTVNHFSSYTLSLLEEDIDGAAITGLDGVFQMGENITATAATTEAGTKTWSSNDAAVASIDSSSGALTALKEGTTTISYTTNASAKTNSKEITVYVAATVDEPSIGEVKVGAGNVTPIEFTDAGSGQTILWISSNTDAATINDSTGVITPVAAGDTTISYVVIDDTTGAKIVKGSLNITVLGEEVNKAALTAAINAEYSDGVARTTLNLTSADYTVGSWSDYADAIDAAKNVELDADATQEQVNDAITAIGSTKAALVFAGEADLITAENNAGALTANASYYTTATWDVLTSALAMAETTNAEVVAKTGAINDAITALRFAAPNVTNNDTANTVTGMTTGFEYNLDGANAGAYTAYVAETFNAINFSGSHTLLVRRASDGVTPAGEVTTLTFTINPRVIGNNFELYNGSNLDAAVDASGNTYVVYERAGKIYLVKNRMAELEVTGGGSDSSPAIAVQSDGTVHIAFVRSGNVKYAKYDGAWTVENVGAGSAPDIDADAGGKAHIAYLNSDQYVDVNYATNTSGAFVSVIVWDGFYWYDNGNKTGRYFSLPSIKIDSSGNYHISAVHHALDGAIGWTDHNYTIVYSTNAGGGSGSDAGYFGNNSSVNQNKNALAMNGDTPYIAYVRSGNIYQYQNTLLTAGSAPASASAGGNIGIVYYNSGVKYIQSSGGAFSGATNIDADGSGAVVAMDDENVFIYYIKAGKIYLSTDKTVAPPIPMVSTPVLSVVGTTVSWGDVSNEEEYSLQIYLNDETTTVNDAIILAANTTSFDLKTIVPALDGGQYKVKVTALGDGINYVDSSRSLASDAITIKSQVSIAAKAGNPTQILNNNNTALYYFTITGTGISTAGDTNPDLKNKFTIAVSDAQNCTFNSGDVNAYTLSRVEDNKVEAEVKISSNASATLDASFKVTLALQAGMSATHELSDESSVTVSGIDVIDPPASAAPALSDITVTRTSKTTINLSVANVSGGNNIRVYTAASGGAPIGNGIVMGSPVTINNLAVNADVATIYVTKQDDGNHAESTPRTAVTLSTYGASVSPSGDQTFTPLINAYADDSQPTNTFTITFTGSATLTNIQAQLSGANSDSFEISGLTATDATHRTFTIKAINDLANDSTHNATVTISADYIDDIIFDITQEVVNLPSLSAPTLSVAGTTVTWGDVDNAVSYVVQILDDTAAQVGSDIARTTAQKSINLALLPGQTNQTLTSGTYTVKVKAVANAATHLDSTFSETSVTLSTKTALEQVNTAATAAEMKTALESNTAEFGISIGAGSDYNKLSASEKLTFAQAMIDGKGAGYANNAAVKTAFEAGCEQALINRVKEIIGDTFTAVEGVNTNILEPLRGTEMIIDTGVTITSVTATTLAGITIPTGEITYDENEHTGTVTIELSYGGTTDTHTISNVTIPAPDTVSPTAGNSGTITATSVAITSLVLNWTAATDNVTPQDSICYYVFQNKDGKTADDMDTIAELKASPAPVKLLNSGGTFNITSYTVTGLNVGTQYHFVVVAVDLADNYVIYTPVSVTSESNDSPTLVEDTTNAVLGQAIEITFTDDSTWRGKVTGVKVNETSVTNYTLASGKLTIPADNFASAGEYTIKVSAEGYADEEVMQTIVAVYVAVKSISLDKETLTINAGDSEALTATVGPDEATDKTVTWSSSNVAVATVDSDGKVTGISKGTSTITATTNNGKKDTCKVTVNTPATSISLDKDAATIDAGKSMTLKATIEPDTATVKTVVWTSCNESIATVTSRGLVKGISAGVVTITASTSDGKFSDTCVVTVNQPVTSVSLDKKTLTISAGDSETLTATVGPDEATDKGVTWGSSNVAVATVDSDGKVTGVGKGTATITVLTVSGNKKAMCRVSVDTPATSISVDKDTVTIDVGRNVTLKATINPDTATVKTIWTSSNESIATVSSRGSVKGISAGTVTITASTSDGKFSDTCVVTVNQPVKSVSLDKKTLTISAGDSETLTATVGPGEATDKTVTWSSSNVAVATVDSDGEVTGVGKGTATITVLTVSGNKKAMCRVSVDTPATSISVDKDTVTIDVGRNVTLKATINPDTATVKTVWTSSDESIAIISSRGAVKAKKAGTVTITVSTSDGKFSDTCVVTVNQPVTSVSLDKKTMTINKGSNATLTVKVGPEDATNKDVTWSSSNVAVATVDSDGKVTAVSEGTATITVLTNNGKKATCRVTVIQMK